MCLLVVLAVFVFTTEFVFARSENMGFPLCSTTVFVIVFVHLLFLNRLVFVFARRRATNIYIGSPCDVSSPRHMSDIYERLIRIMHTFRAALPAHQTDQCNWAR